MRKLRVAAIQCTSLDGEVRRNLDNAERLVDEAVARGAELVLCPEFLAAGYVYDESMWRFAEPAGGATEAWLARIAARHHILLGASFLEAEGDDFYNTFSLFGADGTLAGRVRKGSLPLCEGWLFAPCAGPKVIDTSLGKVGVGICNDNQTAWFLREMAEQRPDIILMPHSAPTPHWPLVDFLIRPAYEAQLRGIARRHARALGVPVVVANKVSRAPVASPMPPVPGFALRFDFHGYSSICDASGNRLAYAERVETALVADVELDPARKRGLARAPRGDWAFLTGATGAFGAGAFRLFAWLGRRSYGGNPRRAVAARAAGASGAR
jgi:N-carbamoylputrescine amidase